MAKGYILVDIPECCGECQLCTYEGDTNMHIGFFCDGSIINDFGFVKIPDEVIRNDLKPDWCPIKELPEDFKNMKFEKPSKYWFKSML